VAAAPRAPAPAVQQPAQTQQTPPPAADGEVLGNLPAQDGAIDASGVAAASGDDAMQVASAAAAQHFATQNKPQLAQQFQR
jgi:hypothetical protein